MADPLRPDPNQATSAAVDEITADLERLRRTASARRPFRLRLRREVRRAELALLALGVVAAGFLALHLAERGNEVSLTAHTTLVSPTTAPGPGHAGTATDTPSENTRSSPPPAPPTTVTAASPSPPTPDTRREVGARTTTTAPTVDAADEGTASTTTTTSTTSTT